MDQVWNIDHPFSSPDAAAVCLDQRALSDVVVGFIFTQSSPVFGFSLGVRWESKRSGTHRSLATRAE